MKNAEPRGKTSTLLMAYMAMGGILGDIGTSPLYVMAIVFGEIKPTRENVMGVLSLITLSFLFLTLKYAYLALKLDNEGEGGTFALLTLTKKEAKALRERGLADRRVLFIVSMATILSLFCGALLLSDGIITPSISVLSAFEGIQVVFPRLHPWVVPLTVVVLVALFSIQRRGTEKIAHLFSPVMVLWFSAIAVLGWLNILKTPWVLEALNPRYAFLFLAHKPLAVTFAVMGIVFLCITGGEAMYADMSHYSRAGIRLAWAMAAFCLLSNYFGQGAFLLRTAHHENLFFALSYAEGEKVYFAMLVLATLAAIIASQAIITGSYTTYKLAMELHYLPRLEIKSTSPRYPGQIYIAPVNWLMMVACLFTVLFFKSSAALGAAYGLAVTGAFIGNTLNMAGGLYLRNYREPGDFLKYVPLFLLFLVFDTTFFGSNLGKIPTGGWFPLVVCAFLAATMVSWYKGSHLLYRRLPKETRREFMERLKERDIAPLPGVRVYMARDPEKVPPSLILEAQEGVLWEQMVLVTVITQSHPWGVDYEKRLLGRVCQERVEVYEVMIEKGYMRSFVHVPHVLDSLDFPPERRYVFGDWQVTVPMPPRRNLLLRYFSFLYRVVPPIRARFLIPREEVVYVGGDVELSLKG